MWMSLVSVARARSAVGYAEHRTQVVRQRGSPTAALCGRLSPVSLLTELDALYLDHRRCGELEGGVDWPHRVDRLPVRGQHGAAAGRR